LSLRSKDVPAQQALAQRILRGSARLSYFFDNCLTQDRIDSHNFALEPAPVDVPALAQYVAEDAGQLSDVHAIEVHIAPDLPPLHGDPVLLRVMLMNLLSNAVKYADAGTSVSLAVTRQGPWCRLTVEDEGPGIPVAEQALVFHKYRRGRAAEGKPGAGLGLALVKRIAQLHGGTATLETREPTGTRCVIDIPFAGTPLA